MELIQVPVTQRTACAALDAVLEVLGDNISQYLDMIMQNLSGLLQTAPIAVKSVVIGAIGSAAHAAAKNFMPYFQPTMQHLVQFLTLTGEGEEQELRGITMDAIGTFGEAIGKEPFRPYFADMMTQAFAGIEMGSARLKECSFLFFGVMANLFGEEFAPYLPQVVPALISSLKQAEHGEEPFMSRASCLRSGLPKLTSLSADNAADFASGTSPATAIEVDGDIEDLDLDLDKMLDVNSTICIEKEIAADVMGGIFRATKKHYMPYVEQSTIELVAQLSHYYDGIRKSSAESLLEIVQTFYELSEAPEWQPGQNVTVPLDKNVKDLIDHVLPPIFEMYETEDNK